MSTGSALTAGLLVVLALAHSLAGETGFIRPLIAADWHIDEVPRRAANRLLRIAWHLTSIAWVALAIGAVGGSALAATSVAALASGVVMFAWVRGHPAWPIFLVAGAAGLWADDLLTTPMLVVGAALAAALSLALAGLHLYWVAGGRWMLDTAVPTTAEGMRSFSPGPFATLAVAGLLTGYAALLVAAIVVDDDVPALRWLILVGVAVLTLRAVGDTRYAGFTKTERSTDFAAKDDRYFTPLAVFLAMGATAAVLL